MGELRSLKPATLLKVTLRHGCFSRFLNCTNGNKSRNAPHISLVLFLALQTLNLSFDEKITSEVFQKSLYLERT